MFLAIFIVSFLATFLSAMSGAGSGMIIIPFSTFIGYTLPQALTASQFQGALWTPVAARNYLRRSKLNRHLILGQLVFGTIGVFLGTRAFLAIEPRLLQQIVGSLILAVALFSFFKPLLGVVDTEPKLSTRATSLLTIPFGFYESFFGTGNGLFVSLFLAKARGLTLPIALGYYYLSACLWCSIAAVLYLREGHGDLSLIIPSTLGSLVGAFLGSHIGSKRGAKFVRMLFVSIGSLMGLKMIFGA